MISSHFSRLKEFAFTSDNVINASMLFDEDNLKPTYIFKQGVPGQSYALEVASRYGLSKEILNEAKNHLDNIKTTDVHQLMNKLHEEALKNDLANGTIDLPARFESARESLLPIIGKANAKVNIKPGRKQVSVKRRDEMFMNPLFLELWNKMKQKTIYRINMDKCNNSLCQEVRNRKSNC